MNKSVAQRRRLAPEDRIEEILDAAARLVMKEGIALNMEKIAGEAGVSKGLLYAYFPNVKALLGDVLVREHRELQRQQLEGVAGCRSFEEMARVTARINRERDNERGLLVRRLRGDPEINQVMVERDRKTRDAVIDYLTRQITDNFDVPRRIARIATELVIGEESGRPDERDDVWGAMMMGAMKELEKRYSRGQEDE